MASIPPLGSRPALDTAGLLRKVAVAPHNSGPGGLRLTPTQLKHVVSGLSSVICSSLRQGKGVELPQLGTVSVAIDPPRARELAGGWTASTGIYAQAPAKAALAYDHQGRPYAEPRRSGLGERSAEPRPVFTLSKEFQAAVGADALDQIQPALQQRSFALSFVELGRRVGIDRSVASGAWELLVRAIRAEVASGGSFRLLLPPLGELECADKALSLAFDATFCREAGLQQPRASAHSRKIMDTRRSAATGPTKTAFAPKALNGAPRGAHRHNLAHPTVLKTQRRADQPHARTPAWATQAGAFGTDEGALLMSPIQSWRAPELRTLGPEHKAKLKLLRRALEIFDILDVNQSGMATADEVKTGILSAIGVQLSPPDAQQVVAFAATTRRSPPQLDRIGFVRSLLASVPRKAPAGINVISEIANDFEFVIKNSKSGSLGTSTGQVPTHVLYHMLSTLVVPNWPAEDAIWLLNGGDWPLEQPVLATSKGPISYDNVITHCVQDDNTDLRDSISPFDFERNARLLQTGSRDFHVAFRRFRDLLYAKKLTYADVSKVFDRDHDGNVTISELQGALMQIDPSMTTSDAAKLAKAADPQHSGEVDLGVLYSNLTVEQDTDWEDKALELIRTRLTERVSEVSLENAFHKFDINGDGVISRDEFRKGIIALRCNLDTEQIDRLMQLGDKDNSGELDVHEFHRRFFEDGQKIDQKRRAARMMQLAIQRNHGGLHGLFDAWDTTGRQNLDLQEFRRGIMSIDGFTDDMVATIFKLADKDKDGFVSWTEFEMVFTLPLSEAKQLLKKVAKTVAPVKEIWATDRTSGDVKSAVDPVQRLRDHFYEHRCTGLEVFEAFDTDNDGFVSVEEWQDAFFNQSQAVANTVGNLSELRFTAADVDQIYAMAAGAETGFISHAAFSAILREDTPEPTWEKDIAQQVATWLDQNPPATLATLFTSMSGNDRSGQMRSGQLKRGLLNLDIQVSAAMSDRLFKLMNTDNDGCICVDEFSSRLKIDEPAWDWLENALHTIGNALCTKHEVAKQAYSALIEAVHHASIGPLVWQEHLTKAEPTVRALKLRSFQWKQLFRKLDIDEDGYIGEADFLHHFKEFTFTGKVLKDTQNAFFDTKLSTAEIFKRVDTSGDGFIDKDEFDTATQLMRPNASRQELSALWNHIDVHGVGKVDQAEFSDGMRDLPPGLAWEARIIEDLKLLIRQKGNLRVVFDAIDTSGDGCLSGSEFVTALGRLGMGLSSRQCQHLLQRIDVNGDGGVDYEEFLAWVNGRSLDDEEYGIQSRQLIADAMARHLGSAEAAFIYCLQRDTENKVVVSLKAFKRGLVDLLALNKQPLVPTEQELKELFNKVGGRGNTVTASLFIAFFTHGTGLPANEIHITETVLWFAQHKKSLLTHLGYSRNGRAATRTCSRQQFRATCEAKGVVLDEKTWRQVWAMADPRSTMLVDFVAFLSRCKLRYDAASQSYMSAAGRSRAKIKASGRDIAVAWGEALY